MKKIVKFKINTDFWCRVEHGTGIVINFIYYNKENSVTIEHKKIIDEILKLTKCGNISIESSHQITRYIVQLADLVITNILKKINGKDHLIVYENRPEITLLIKSIVLSYIIYSQEI
jgi:23S rRNA maturation-related 3'-5' exoribonuclease YhaM